MNVVLTRTEAENALGVTLPHGRMEEWKWTNLRTLIDKPYPPRLQVEVQPVDVARINAASPFAAVAATRMVFVNGHYDVLHSKMPNGAAASRAPLDEPVIAMNAAFADDGAKLLLSGTVDTPIELVFITTDGAPRTIATRNVIEIAAGSSVTLVETHLGEGAYINNSVTEIHLGEGARLDRLKVEHDAANAVHLAHTHVTLAANAKLREFTLTSGARVNRQNGTYAFTGENADAKVAGAYLLAGKQHADTRLVVDHQVPNCVSRELFKCVMDDHARGIFQGKVIVRPDAQKTDGKQSSHALLLSETAEFDAKPELEIFADDVVCGHGATSGDLNHEYLFYLMSRGIPKAQAKSLLIAAFVGEAFDAIEHDGLREAMVGYAETWLTHHRKGGAA
jgi:Fe-S cluster assembly protein SufD